MFMYSDLRMPLIAAPMAGGPSTPGLVAAAAAAGGLGILAAGYKTVPAMAEELEITRGLSDNRLGINLFVPAPPGPVGNGSSLDRAALVAGYRRILQEEADRYGVSLPEPDPSDTDAYAAKVDYVVAHPLPLVSFTFGTPEPDVVERLHRVGMHVTVTVTDAAEARAAVRCGADSLCVQGPDGGGHRGTHTAEKSPGSDSLGALLTDLRRLTTLPLIAAGGVRSAANITGLLGQGAAAVQLGTLLLRSPESGAQQTHKDALVSGRYTGTTLTRAFSGRFARGLTNRFIRAHDGQAPAAYPEVNQLTRPLRAAAAAVGDADGLALWAGVGFAACRAEPAEQIMAELWREACAAAPTDDGSA
ncbi:nitronate monooxygenase [Paenarthrobacter sp. PH39-S1]|uniref:nitronate monooxygenase n=1 Tax=Paenarthrobacter sp. PH39-S1 TaxID=3046204 RepID=UPI0024B9604B|nr:nitronate monooxygenase [Paenarthrobacter sp. PH39-S1]MDJ0355327.1 nitronate monooxygenase [Paenarthrobacter sp. PH39-S1]